MLGAGLQEVAVILNADNHAESLAVLGALANAVGDPLLYLVASGARRHGLPGLTFHLRVGKHTEDGSAEPSGDLDPFLDMLNASGTNGFVRGREVVANAGSA